VIKKNCFMTKTGNRKVEVEEYGSVEREEN